MVATLQANVIAAIHSISIAEVSVRSIGGCTPAIGNAAQSWTHRRGLLFTLQSDKDLVGLGEGSPLLGHSKETAEQVKDELTDVAEKIGNVGELRSVLGVKLSSSAQLAVDSALAELVAKTLEVSVAQLIGNRSPSPVPASQLIDIGGEPAEIGSGIRCVKFKVGPFAAWPTQWRALDQFIAQNPHTSVRLDFNSTLEPSEAAAVASQLCSVSRLAALDYVEDPGTEIKAWTAPWPCPLAVDHLVGVAATDQQALACIEERGASVAILKPALCGGLFATQARAEHLSRHGIEPVISHLLDGPIALGAYAELACSIAALRINPRAAAVGPHRALAAFSKRPFAQLRNGILYPIVHGPESDNR